MLYAINNRQRENKLVTRAGFTGHGLAEHGAGAEAHVAALVRARRDIVAGARAHAAARARRPLRPRRHGARARRVRRLALVLRWYSISLDYTIL